jgi:drug/metabolite transporter (DMT)-like permease
MHKNKVTFKIILLLIFSDIMETFIQFCFKKSALHESGLQVDSLSNAIIFLRAVSSSEFFWLGLFSVIAVFIIWSTILSKIDLSVAVPIASFSYMLVPLTSIIFLHEKISALRWLGIFLILVGVIFVTTSAEKKAAIK